MPDAKTSFDIKTHIAGVAEKQSGRFATSGIQVTPGNPMSGEVYLCATDTRGLVVTVESGFSDREMVLSAGPIGKVTKSKPVRVEVNGEMTVNTLGRNDRWVKSDSFPDAELEGRFPEYAPMIQKTGKGWRAITINADVLQKMQAAMIRNPLEQLGVTILIPPEKADRDGNIESELPVIVGDSFGLIRALEGGFSAAESGKRFNELVSDFRTAREAAISARSAE